MSNTLSAAVHEHPSRYWEGGNYELNMTFEMLRDRQWHQIIQTIWEHSAMYGPLAGRFSPLPNAQPGGKQAIQAPPPTAALIQHGMVKIGALQVGCDVQATRSLFECVSILIPLGMFEGIEGGAGVRLRNPQLSVLDEIFYDIALAVYDTVPFQIAAIGYERACQLISELRTDSEARHHFLVSGNFLAQDQTLLEIEPDLSAYQVVRPNLRWLAPRF